MKTRFAVVIAPIATSAPTHAAMLPTPCFMVDRDRMMAGINQETGGRDLDVLGDIHQVGHACETRLLTTDGVEELRFEIVFVQGKQYCDGSAKPHE